jgi:hypothetical protein
LHAFCDNLINNGIDVGGTGTLAFGEGIGYLTALNHLDLSANRIGWGQPIMDKIKKSRKMFGENGKS